MTYVLGIKRCGVTAIIADMRVTRVTIEKDGSTSRVGLNNELKSGILFPGCIFGIAGNAQAANEFIDRAREVADHAGDSIEDKWAAFVGHVERYRPEGTDNDSDRLKHAFRVVLASRASGKTELFLYDSLDRSLKQTGEFVPIGSGADLTLPLSEFVDQLDESIRKIAHAVSPTTLRISWFADGTAILLFGQLVDSVTAQGRNHISIHFAIPFTGRLPNGNVGRKTPIRDLLRILAESFGVEVSAHPDEPPVFVYTGPADDGKYYPICGKVDPRQILVGGIASPRLNRTKWTHCLVLLNRQKYVDWYRENLFPKLSDEWKTSTGKREEPQDPTSS